MPLAAVCLLLSLTLPALPAPATPPVGAAAATGSTAPPQDPPKPPDPADAKKPPTPEHTGLHALFKGLGNDIRHLPSTDNLLIAAVGGAGALAVHPLDPTFNVHLRSHYDLVNDIYSPAKWVGQSPVQAAASLVIYAVGRLDDKPKAAHLGMDLLRAQIISEAMTDVIKFSVWRERPNGADHLSFPSGHSAITFTTATVIERHLGWKYSVLGYAIAAYVASSRLHDNVHYLSDVVFGAAVGTISGRTVTQHGRNTWTFVPAGLPGGVEIVAMRLR